MQEKLENKNHALDALKSSLKPDSKLLTILDKEVDWLKMEKRQLEAHLSRTEIWGEHLGKWRAVVQSVEVTFLASQTSKIALITNYDSRKGFRWKGATSVYDSGANWGESWRKPSKWQSGQWKHLNRMGCATVAHRVSCDLLSSESRYLVLNVLTFQELNRKLRPLCPEIRTLDLPSTAFKLFFIKNDKASSEKAKGQIQKYLNVG